MSRRRLVSEMKSRSLRLDRGIEARALLFIAGGAIDGTLLPLASIYHRPDGKPAVWVYDPETQKVALRGVTVGAYREDGVTITAGVKHGEWVVAAGANKLVAGQTVRPYDEPNRPAPPAASPSSQAVRTARG